MGPPPLLPEDDEPLPFADEPPEDPLEDPVLATAAVTVIDADANVFGSAVEVAEIVTADASGRASGSTRRAIRHPFSPLAIRSATTSGVPGTSVV